MNIEKINKLYENMISLQQLFEEENSVDAINGLRFASAEFRHAFFKVRETLLKSPVGKQTQPQTQQAAEKTETEKENKSSKPTTKKAVTTATTTKKKEERFIVSQFVNCDNEGL